MFDLEAKSAALVKSNLFAYYDFLAQSLPDHDAVDDVTMMLTALPASFMNPAIYSGPQHTTYDECLNKVKQYCAAKSIKQYAWWHRDPSLDEECCAKLEAHGFDRAQGEVCMSIDLDTTDKVVTAKEITIVTVNNNETLEQWSSLASAGFTMSAMDAKRCVRLFEVFLQQKALQLFIARKNGIPVATAQLFIDSANIAGLYWISTLPDYRKQGLGAAITSHALLYAKKAGHRKAVLQSSVDGKALYESLGFIPCGRLTYFVHKD